MLQRLAPYFRWIDSIYDDQSAFARLRARLLLGVNIGVLLFIPLNIAKVLWLNLPETPGRILFNFSLVIAATASLMALRRGRLILAGDLIALLSVVIVHLFTFTAPISTAPVGLAFQVFLLDIVFLLMTLVFASRRASYLVLAVILVGHVSLYFRIHNPGMDPEMAEVAAIVLRDGSIAIVVIYLLGLTLSGLIAAANRRSEESLAETRALNTQLEELVAKRTRDLKAASQRAEDASRAKSEFLANMSHEIRTPLNGVIATAELLQRDTSLSAETQERVRLVAHSGDLLLRLLGDILDLSKIEAGQLTLENHAFDLRQLMTDTMALFASRASANNVQFEIDLAPDLPEHVEADSHRLRQVLSNLASNAIKFTPAGGRIRVTVRTAGDDLVRFEVKDTGAGMDAATLAKVFERFTQADASTTRRYGGTGLGLPICLRLVELMGGTLRAESEPGRGSTFHFTLPLQASAAAPNSTADEPWQTSPLGLRVLLVEDNRVNRTILAAQLRELGCSCTLATDGEQALEVLRHASPLPDVVLMDCHMPKLDGWEATRRIRGWAETAETTGPHQAASRLPIIALTAAALPEERERCAAAGMNGFIAKPAKLGNLHRCLREHAERGAIDPSL